MQKVNAELADIIWQTMSDKFRKIVEMGCWEYENNPKYKIIKFYEENVLKGFCVYHDENDTRILDEAHYIGNNRFIALKIWRIWTENKSKLRADIQKANTKMIKFMKQMKFKIIGESLTNIVFERVK